MLPLYSWLSLPAHPSFLSGQTIIGKVWSDGWVWRKIKTFLLFHFYCFTCELWRKWDKNSHNHMIVFKGGNEGMIRVKPHDSSLICDVSLSRDVITLTYCWSEERIHTSGVTPDHKVSLTDYLIWLSLIIYSHLTRIFNVSAIVSLTPRFFQDKSEAAFLSPPGQLYSVCCITFYLTFSPPSPTLPFSPPLLTTCFPPSLTPLPTPFSNRSSE